MEKADKNQLDAITKRIDDTIHMLYNAVTPEAKNALLQGLRAQLRGLYTFVDERWGSAVTDAGNMQAAQGRRRRFTPAQLAAFDGRNGSPAYVAVNGVVYDVTNNATWAAATHFGLRAGADLTDSFTSCHSGQDILKGLDAVGRLEYERDGL